QELQDVINKYGGEMPQTWGVPVEEIQRGIKHGVRKINIDTDNRMAMTGAIRKVFAENPGEFDPRKYLGPAMAAMRAVCKRRLERPVGGFVRCGGQCPDRRRGGRPGHVAGLLFRQPRPLIPRRSLVDSRGLCADAGFRADLLLVEACPVDGRPRAAVQL